MSESSREEAEGSVHVGGGAGRQSLLVGLTSRGQTRCEFPDANCFCKAPEIGALEPGASSPAPRAVVRGLISPLIGHDAGASARRLNERVNPRSAPAITPVIARPGGDRGDVPRLQKLRSVFSLSRQLASNRPAE